MKLLALLVVTIAATSVPSSASPIQSDALRESAFRDYRADSGDEENVVRHLDSIGGGHLLRELDGLSHFPRRTRSGLDSLSGASFGGNKRFDTLSGISFGNQKRNFDEIDRSGFNSFVKKNLDEIDRSGFDSFVKRNFDEIDRVGFGSFVKRNAPLFLTRYYDKQENH
uniref:Orcokinin A neuropeptide n=1 Tax=Blattella germanica TaxID=6973 RepID=A0A0K0QPL7_BLAGE|nr:orcokinin A neuropeptide precursor [Blattella germanica]